MTHALNKVAKAGLLSLGLFGLAALSTPAQALIVSPGTNPAEPSLFTIMNQIYGTGTWTQIDDSLYQHSTDVNQSYLVTFTSRYASDNSQFGVNTNQTSYTPLINLGPAGAQPQSIIVTPSMQASQVGGLFTWAFKDLSSGLTFSTDKTKNADGLDHVIFFELNGSPNDIVMAWEDSIGGDYDYNDAVFEVSFTNVPTPVPEPGTIALIAAACLGAGIYTRRKSKDR